MSEREIERLGMNCGVVEETEEEETVKVVVVAVVVAEAEHGEGEVRFTCNR